MENRRIILNHSNYQVLKGLVETLQRTGKLKLPHFARFAKEMKDAIVMNTDTIPDQVITIHSRVTYTDADAGTTSESVIVFPVQTHLASDHISILSPLGMALIGERMNTIVEYAAPGGTYRLSIDNVQQNALQLTEEDL